MQRIYKALKHLQTSKRVAEQRPIDIAKADIVIMGMGRLGTGVYDYLYGAYGERVIGFDANDNKAQWHESQGRNVLVGDASDQDVWLRLPKRQIKKVVLALSNHSETKLVTRMLQDRGYSGVIAAVARFDDDLEELRDMGVIAFNLYAEAGAGFAEHVVAELAVGDGAV